MLARCAMGRGTAGAYNDDEFPVDSRQVVLISKNHLIRCADDRELIRRPAALEMLHHFGPENLLALGGVSVVHDDRNRRGPVMELVHPV